MSESKRLPLPEGVETVKMSAAEISVRAYVAIATAVEKIDLLSRFKMANVEDIQEAIDTVSENFDLVSPKFVNQRLTTNYPDFLRRTQGFLERMKMAKEIYPK